MSLADGIKSGRLSRCLNRPVRPECDMPPTGSGHPRTANLQPKPAWWPRINPLRQWCVCRLTRSNTDLR